MSLGNALYKSYKNYENYQLQPVNNKHLGFLFDLNFNINRQVVLLHW